jgi:O-antigen ligase
VTRNTGSGWLHAGLLTLTLVVLAWGALAFGAVYAWAYQPLAVGCAIVGLAALALGRRHRPPLLALAIGLLAVGLGIGVQLVPLPVSTLAKISPSTDRFLRQYDFSYGAARPTSPDADPESAVAAPHPISIAPERSVVGLGLFVCLALFFLGIARLASVMSADTVSRPLVIFGVMLAIVGIAQAGLTSHQVHPLIYGFWRPKFESRPFGPFVNPNHFAGWMLMVLPIALGLFYDRLLRGLEWVSGRDNRIDIVNAPGFAGLLLYGFASVLMGVSLVMTRSRSALGAFLVASLLASWLVLKRLRTAKARIVAVAAFVVLFGGVAAWAGVDALFSKFTESSAGISSVGGRVGAWQDTARIMADFPITGTGFNTYGRAMALYERSKDLHFNEAHNDYLQILAEGGLLVGIPVAVALLLFARAIRRRFVEAPRDGTTYWVRIGSVIGLIAIALQSAVEFSLQMPGNAALFAVVAALAIHQSPNLRKREPAHNPAKTD